MSNLFYARKRESAVDIVVNSIKNLLMNRQLKPGDKLPSELEISEGLAVSRGSVREAMKILSAFGLIDIRVGDGTYIAESPVNGFFESSLFTFFITNPDINNLYELRQVFETDVLELILKHYDENLAERNAIKQNLIDLERLMEGSPSPKELLENDLEFHRRLGSATLNPLVERVYNFILDFMKPSIHATHKNQKGEYIHDIHKDVIELIESKDDSRIKDVIKTSVDTWSLLQFPEES